MTDNDTSVSVARSAIEYSIRVVDSVRGALNNTTQEAALKAATLELQRAYDRLGEQFPESLSGTEKHIARIKAQK